jgi:hypothetical protein
METIIKRNPINFKGKNVNIAIDVYKHSWLLAALLERLTLIAGTLLRQKNGAFSDKFFSMTKTALLNELRSRHAFLTFTPSFLNVPKGANLSKHVPYQIVRSSQVWQIQGRLRTCPVSTHSFVTIGGVGQRQPWHVFCYNSR